jgi:dephospho-CoA kinase
MGKSTIAEMFRRSGVPVHDSDKTVHELMSPSGAAFAPIATIFPETIENGKINRQKLGAVIFNDVAKKDVLESILHPMVRQASDEFVKQNRHRGLKIVALDIPLLFETNGQNRVDYTICVSAPHFIQKRRVLARPNMTEEKFKTILQSQWSDALKRCCSDFIINTAHSKAQSMRDVKKIIARVLKK